jgi:ELWxxDGT repeat protein
MSDGTAQGTVLVKDIVQGGGGSLPAMLTNVNGTLFFAANDGSTGVELWKSNGTPQGTELVKDISPNLASSILTALVNVNGTLFLALSETEAGAELWKSNGTAEGTVRVKDILMGPAGSGPTGLTDVNGTLFFAASDGVTGIELWKSDGTPDGTVLVKNIRPDAAPESSPNSRPAMLTNVNGTLYFRATDDATGTELWKSDGTGPGTERVRDIWPGADSSTPDALTNASGTLFFSANDGTNGIEPWTSNGTEGGTALARNIAPLGTGSAPASLTARSGAAQVYFQANDGSSGAELWRSDGSLAGTARAADIFPGPSGSSPGSLVMLGSSVYFAATGQTSGLELWSLYVEADGDADGDGLLDSEEAAFDSNPADPDSDDDGLLDGPEVHTHGSSPVLVDTDADGYTDPVEVAAGTSPGSATSTPCGNSTLEGPETCDAGAGNGTAQTCCSAQCRVSTDAHICRTAADICDVPETCNGASATCPANGFQPTTTLCRVDQGECDVPEFCNGAGACPPDAFSPQFTLCGSASSLDCDAPDSCNAAGQCIDRVDSAATVCRAAAGTCDVAENCDGAGKTCGPNAFEPAGTACGSPLDTACTDPDSCDGSGSCRANHAACAAVTDAALCPFDAGENVCDAPGEDAHTSQVRLQYATDAASYRLDLAAPPGAAYNAIVKGTPGPQLVRVTVPYPYVTSAAPALRIYDAAQLAIAPGNGCFLPGGAPLATGNTAIALQDYLALCNTQLGSCRNGVGACALDADCVRPNAAGVTCSAPTGTACDASSGPDSGGSCSFDVNLTLPASGEVYLNLQLDYGLDGASVDFCSDGSPERYEWAVNAGVGGLDAVEDAPPPADVAIANCTDYAFGHSAGLAVLQATVESLNVFDVCQAGDTDCDGIGDGVDECPHYAGNVQGEDEDEDGRGDACECGDQNGDGLTSVSDLVSINAAIFNPSLVTELCDANNDTQCNVNDIIATNSEIFSPGNTSTCSRQPVPGP